MVTVVGKANIENIKRVALIIAKELQQKGEILNGSVQRGA